MSSDAEHAAKIADRYADWCDEQAEPNHQTNLAAWRCWKDHAHAARKVADLIRAELPTSCQADACGPTLDGN